MLLSDTIHADGTHDWQQEYDLDRYGNRLIHQTNTWGGVPKPNFGIDPANNNRLTAPAGYTMSYDNAGNLTNDNYTGQGQRTYDAENRMTQAWANGQWQVYTYDGEGYRRLYSACRRLDSLRYIPGLTRRRKITYLHQAARICCRVMPVTARC